MKNYLYLCIKDSETPEHVHSTIFIKGEEYNVSLCNSVHEKVKEKMRQWRMSCGAMAVMCEDVEDVMYDSFFHEEKEKEEFVRVRGKFKNSLGGSETKEQSILKTICRDHLVLIKK